MSKLWPAITTVVGALVFSAGVAWAAPPPEGSEDWQIMKPYASWVQSQHFDRVDTDEQGHHKVNSYWCCDIGDGRPVDAEIRDGAWWVHVTPQHFPSERDRWLPVPDERLVRAANPVGVPILWMYSGHIQCFAPPDGT